MSINHKDVSKVVEFIALDVCCECGELYSPAPKDFIYIEPKNTAYHFRVEWNCRECGDECWDEGDFLYEWLGQRSQRSPAEMRGFSMYKGEKTIYGKPLN